MLDDPDRTNPYASPVAEEVAAATNDTASGGSGWGWALGYGVNLPVPIFFAIMFIGPVGFAGMVVGIAIVMAAGVLFAKRFGPFDRAAKRGGVLLALSQLFPMLQMICGMIAGSTLEKLGYRFDTGMNGPAAVELGFVPCVLAVLMVSTMLMLPAVCIGLLQEQVFPKQARTEKAALKS